MDPLLILLFIVLFLLSAFFSGTEIALMSLPSHKINALVKEKRFGSKSLKRIKRSNDKLLITILIGNNLVNVYTAALATTLAISMAENLGYKASTAIGVATGAVTFLLLLFGEIIPKSYASKNAASIALLVAPVYKGLMFILFPVVALIDMMIKVFSNKDFAHVITEEEFESFVDMGKDVGALEHAEHEKIKNILEFGDILVEEIMVPRVQLDALDIDSTVGEALDFYLTHTHSRIPVFSDTIDDIDFFFTIRELVNEDRNKKLSAIGLNEVIKVPLNQPIDKLLITFQKSHKHLAIALDEYGGVAGLVTLEDIIEEIFGDIRDETDKEEDEIVANGTNSFIIESITLLEEICDEFHLELEDFENDLSEFSGETVSYFLTHKLERFPEVDEVISFPLENRKEHFIQFKILGIENGKIGKIEVKLMK